MDQVYLGTIMLSGLSFAPRATSYCAGQLTSISQNTALYSLIGTFFGGDGRTTFKYPNFNSRAPVGSASMGSRPGVTSYPLGYMSGSDVRSLDWSNLASHSHSATFTGGGSSSGSASLNAVKDSAKNNKPATNDYLGATKDGFNDGDAIYYSGDEPNDSEKVLIGGVDVTFPTISGGTVSLGFSGGDDSFSIMQPSRAVSYILVVNGDYPTRN